MASPNMGTFLERVQVLDGLLQGQIDTDDILGSLVTREGLLDALLTLHDECGHETLMKNKYVAAFFRKCK